jgi:malonyl CoA-acyl carrier protein transacylase/acyl carrier protein
LVETEPDRLSDYIYPPPAFTAEQRAEQDRALRDTTIAQPALGAVSLAALQVLRSFGIQPDATAGHSFGELTALCAAGCYDAPSLFALSQLRGRLMAQNDGDRGAMLAVMAPIEEVESVVRQERVDVVVANRNSPTQAVLSGSTTEIERAERSLQKRRLHHVRLPVAAAFHSPLVAGAYGPFRAALEPIDFQEAQLPVFANSTSQEYPRDPQAIRDLLAAQLSRPVDFVTQIRNMVQTGVRTFVEVGPGHTLTRLVGSILGDEPHTAIALDASAGQRTGLRDLAAVVGCLAALGHPVDLNAWDPKVPPARVPKGPVFPICGANYRAPQTEQEIVPPRPRSLSPSKPKTMAKPAEPRQESPAPANPTVDAANVQRALQMTQESLAAFQRLQEQTAELHRVFLEQQTQAQQTLQQLLAGQQQILAAGMPLPMAVPPTASAPRPAAVRGPTLSPPLPKPVMATPPLPKPVMATPPPPRPVSSPSPQVSPPQPVVVAPPPGNDLMTALLTIVAEKTGYPVEMLNPDMGLDADLGIDSIKRVEILSALQERRPDTPSVPPDRLGSLRTLREVVDLLDVSEPAPAATPPVPTPSSAESTDITADLLAVVAEKTGYPADMLNLDMGLDSDLGIDSIKRVEILSALQERLPETPTVAPDRLGSLRTLRDVAEVLGNGGAEKKNSRRLVMT